MGVHHRGSVWGKSAAQNDSLAQCKLGICYQNGLGVQKDYAEAAKWFRKAAEQNDSLSQSTLGIFYELGRGVPKDYVEAYKWTLLAAGREETSKLFLSSLEHEMSPEQIAEGQKRARDFTIRPNPTFKDNTSQ